MCGHIYPIGTYYIARKGAQELDEESAVLDIEGTSSRLEGHRTTALGRIQVFQRIWAGPIDIVSFAPFYWLQIALLPRPGNVRGCFPNQWAPHRFEPIGEMFLLPAGQVVHAQHSGYYGRQRSIACIFPPDAMRDWFDDEFKWTDGRLLGGFDIMNPMIRQQLLALGEEVSNPGFATDAIVEFMMGQIAIQLARHCIGIPETKAVGGLACQRRRKNVPDGGAIVYQSG